MVSNLFLKRPTAYIFSAFLFLLPALLAAQEQGKPFVRYYSPKEYGSEPQNWAIVQDKRGFVYFGHDGLLEFDGARWRNIDLPNNASSRSLALGDDGILYVGGDGDFGYMAPDARGQLSYISLLTLLDTAARKNIGVMWHTDAAGPDIYFTARKKIYMATKTAPGKYTLKTIQPGPGKEQASGSFTLGGVFYTDVSGIGLCRLRGGVLEPAPGGAAVDSIPFHSSAPYGEKARLLATYTQGLYVYESSGALRKLDAPEAETLSKTFRLYGAGRLADGNFALGFTGAGVRVVNPEGKILRKLTMAEGLGSDDPHSFMTDAQGGVWVALNNGVARAELVSPLSFWDESSGLKAAVEMTLRHKGYVYVVTHSNAFAIDKTGAVLPVAGIPNGQCWSLHPFITPAGDTLLMAGTHDGVYQIDGLEAKQVMRGAHSMDMLQSKTRPERLIVSTNPAAASLLWQNGKWVSEGLIKEIDDDIRGIAEEADGTIWLTSFRRGAYKITLSEDWKKPASLKLYTEKDGLPSIKNTLPYRSGDGWIFATDMGVCRYDKATDRFTPDLSFGKQFADGSRGVFFFMETPEKAVGIWATGLLNAENPIGFLKKQAGGGYAYDTEPFKKIPAMFLISAAAEPGGVAWLGGSEGLYKYDPSVKKDYKATFPAHIRGVFIGRDSAVYLGTPGEGVKFASGIALPYDDNSMTFHFSAADYGDDGNLLYSYMLEGMDADWSKPGKDIKKEYTNLWEGEYVFKVKATNIYGAESSTAEYSVKISPPWARTWWAYSAYSLLGVLVLYLSVNLYSRKLKADNDHLEGIVKERTAEITQKKEEIEVQAENLQSLNDAMIEKNAELEQRREEIEAQSEALSSKNDALQTQQEEILLKNVELEQQNEEIEAQAESLREANQLIGEQKENLEKAFQDVRILSQIGREITSTLDLEVILKTVYNHVNELMDASIFGIGIYQAEQNSIRYELAMEKGMRYEPYSRSMANKNQLPVWCIENKKPIFIQNIKAEYGEYIASYDDKVYTLADGTLAQSVTSLIYVPLIVHNEVLGVVTVQSYELAAYSNYHFDMLNNLAVYISTAISNSKSYDFIKGINQHITDSIRYAETIQRAILPSDHDLSEMGRDHFVVFRPKDIVSGDFYWYARLNAEQTPDGLERFFVAVIDCTGHGVPGAFMSMIGNTLMNEIVNQNKVCKPSEIMELLDQGIRLALHQESKANDDGMDVCLCVFEFGSESSNISFCGAKRSLLYVESPGQEVLALKGDKRSIGGLQLKMRPFTTQEIRLPKGAAVYLSSDGFADQSGPDGHKFGSVKLMGLLKDNAGKPLAEQASILETELDEHQQSVDQRDDMTLIGIRI